MLFRFKSFFGQPRMCTEVTTNFPSLEDEEESKSIKGFPFPAWDQETYQEQNAGPSSPWGGEFKNGRLVLLSPTQQQDFLPQTGTVTIMEKSTEFQASKREKLSLPLSSRNKHGQISSLISQATTFVSVKTQKGSYQNFNHFQGQTEKGRTRCEDARGWTNLPHSYSATENLTDAWRLSQQAVSFNHSSGDKLTYFGAEIITESPKDQIFSTFPSNNDPTHGFCYSQSDIYKNSVNSGSRIQSTRRAVLFEDRGFHSSDNLDAVVPDDPLNTFIPNGSYNAFGPSLVNNSVKTLSDASTSSSRRSSIKSSTKRRRRSRHSSGHSVTFDLPTDCDNLCLPLKMPSEPLLDKIPADAMKFTESATSKHRTPPHFSKSLKEKSNEAKKILPKQKSLSNLTRKNMPLAIATPKKFQHSKDWINSIEPVDLLKFEANELQYNKLIQQQLDFINDSTCLPATPSPKGPRNQEESNLEHFKSYRREQVMDSTYPPQETTSTMFSSLPNSWGYNNVVGLFPPMRNAINSIGWSSGDSSGDSSDHRGLDSGYWGRGVREEIPSPRDSQDPLQLAIHARRTESSEDALPAEEIQEEKKKTHRTKHRIKRGGVKVVTMGKQFFLPYAYLDEGRMKLNIVRGECEYYEVDMTSLKRWAERSIKTLRAARTRSISPKRVQSLHGIRVTSAINPIGAAFRFRSCKTLERVRQSSGYSTCTKTKRCTVSMMLSGPPNSQNEPQNLTTSQVPPPSQPVVMVPHNPPQWHLHPQPLHIMYPGQQDNAASSQTESNSTQTTNQQQQQNEQAQQLARLTSEQLAQLPPPPLVEHSIWSTDINDTQNGINSSYMNEIQRQENESTLNPDEITEEEEQEVKPKIKKEIKKKRKLADLLAEGIDPTKLEENSEQVRDRFSKGCECEGDNCFKNMNPEFVFRHRLNIAELTKNEHDMYLMGVTMACLANPEETSRHKERKRLRASYVFQGKKVCLDAFLYLENCTHYQLKAIRKHVMVNGVTPRVHGNHGKKPPNTFPLDTYQHAAAFLQSYIGRYSPNSNTPKKPNKQGKSPPVYLPADITRKKIHNAYKEYCEHFEPDVKVMGYSSFRHFMKEQFPNVKFFRMDKKSERSGIHSEDDEDDHNPSTGNHSSNNVNSQQQDPRTDLNSHQQVMQPPSAQPQQTQEAPKDSRNTPPVTSAPPSSLPPNPHPHPGIAVSMPPVPISSNYQTYSHIPLNLQTQQPLYSACMQTGVFPPGQTHPPQVRPTGFPYTNL